MRRAVLLLAATALAACAQAPASMREDTTPAPALASTPAPALASTPSPEPSFDPAEIGRWITFRERYGLRSDRAWVLQVAAAPASTNDTGIPLLPTELDQVGNMVRRQNDLIASLVTYGESRPDANAGTIVDGRTVVLLVKGDVAPHVTALATLMPGRTGYEVRSVRYSLAELTSLSAQVNAESAWFASVGIDLGSASPDIATNRVGVTFLAPSDAVDALILAHFGHPDWLDPQREGPLPWHGPTGELVVRVVDRNGRPLENMICEALPLDPAVDYNPSMGGLGKTGANGVCRAGDVPAAAFDVRVITFGGGDVKVLGRTRATVVANGTTRVRIVVEH